MNLLRPILALALLALVAEVPCARADETGRAAEIPEALADSETHARGGVSLDEAIAMVERRYKARVVRAETRRDGDQVVYVLRVLKDSRVWTVRVNAETGAIQ